MFSVGCLVVVYLFLVMQVGYQVVYGQFIVYVLCVEFVVVRIEGGNLFFDQLIGQWYVVVNCQVVWFGLFYQVIVSCIYFVFYYYQMYVGEWWFDLWLVGDYLDFQFVFEGEFVDQFFGCFGVGVGIDLDMYEWIFVEMMMVSIVLVVVVV